MNNEQQIHEE